MWETTYLSALHTFNMIHSVNIMLHLLQNKSSSVTVAAGTIAREWVDLIVKTSYSSCCLFNHNNGYKIELCVYNRIVNKYYNSTAGC